MNKNVDKLYKPAVILLIISGILIRLYFYILNPPFRFDEASLALNLFSGNIFSLFEPLEYNQYAPPLFMIISKFMAGFFGCGEYVLRFLPLLAGIVSLPVFYLLSQRVFKNKYTVIFSLILFNFSLPFIFYSRDFKQYSFEVLICLLSFLIFYKLDLSKISYKKSLALGFFLSLTYWFSYANLVVSAGIFTYIILKSNRKEMFGKIFCLILPSLISFITLYYTNIRYFSSSGLLKKYWNFAFINYDFSNIFNVINNVVSYLFSLGINEGNFFASALLIFCVTCLIYGILKNKDDSSVLLFLMPVLISLILSYLKIYPIGGRLSLYLLPSFIILILYPLDNIYLFKNTLARFLQFILIFSFALLFIIPKSFNNFYTADDLYRSRAKYVLLDAIKYNFDNNPVVLSGCLNDTWDFYSRLYNYKNPHIYKLNQMNKINYKKGMRYCFVTCGTCHSDGKIPLFSDKNFKPDNIGIKKYDAVSFYCLYKK